MIICPNCKHEEYPGALFCSKCGAQFSKLKEGSLTTEYYSSSSTAEADEILRPTPTFPKPPRRHKGAEIALVVLAQGLAQGDTIYLEDKDEFSLGRATAGQPVVPDIDLSPYNAYETGVSRLHASINIKNRPINVQDLGSVNGTRVNGKRLNPHSATIIEHGDILTLGKMKIQVLIKEE